MMRCVLILLWFIGLSFSETSECEVEKAFESSGLLRLGLLLRNCDSELSPKGRTDANSAIWTTKQLNHLNYTQPYKVGLTVFKVCSEQDYYNAIFEIFKSRRREFVLGVLSDQQLNENVEKFSDTLKLPVSVLEDYNELLVRAAVKLLVSLDWRQNVTVFSERKKILEEFRELSRTHLICVGNFILIE